MSNLKIYVHYDSMLTERLLSIEVLKNMNVHKEILSVNEDKVLKKFKDLLSELKGMKDFVSFGTYFTTIDYYEDYDGYYSLPTYRCVVGKNVERSLSDYEVIPKDWEQVYVLHMRKPATIRGINKYLSLFNITLTAEETKQIKKLVTTGLVSPGVGFVEFKR